MTEIPEQTLVAEFQAGDDVAFVHLYNRYKYRVYRFCLRMIGDDEVARDVVQSVFLKVYEERGRLNHTDRFQGWVFTVARNMCLTQHRHDKYYARDDHEEDYASASNVHDDVARSEESELLIRALGSLKPEYREVLVLREYEECSYREIADIVGCTESAVKSRIFAARQKLYQVLKPLFMERS